ncbi:hypothetical protein [Oerskovia merdavium]|uniref:Uncharacterized protein n=1 Tax=Oerskovia merdavium TaxID=2762227 RepID=A0ABR8TX00_9CELL|nr:hypothetical protein [Oerskovia merdavium]MBD7980321.1 hypothetical protein [Oerskovia merdavium]
MRFATKRWRLAVLGAAIAPVVVLVTAGATPTPQPTDVQIDLYQDGVATAGPGVLLRLPAGMGATYLDGSRVLDPAALDPAWLTDGIDAADGEVDRLSQVAGSPVTAGSLLDVAGAERAEPRPGPGSPPAGSRAQAPASRSSARTPCSTCTP